MFIGKNVVLFEFSMFAAKFVTTRYLCPVSVV